MYALRRSHVVRPTDGQVGTRGAGGARPDVVVLDLYLHGEDPDIDAVGALARAHKVLIMSASGRGPDVLAAAEAGAVGYLTKQADERAFLTGVRAVAAGNRRAPMPEPVDAVSKVPPEVRGEEGEPAWVERSDRAQGERIGPPDLIGSRSPVASLRPVLRATKPSLLACEPGPPGEGRSVGTQEQPRLPRWESHLDLTVLAASEEVPKVRGALVTLGLPTTVLDDASLLLSELLSNSIEHSGLQPDQHVRVTAEWSGGSLRVTVRDRPARSPPPPLAGSIRPQPGAESGWGLFLVDRIATRWGTLDDDDGGGYWFELDPETD